MRPDIFEEETTKRAIDLTAAAVFHITRCFTALSRALEALQAVVEEIVFNKCI